ncbi:hypothetical protein BC829DRAFT_357698, partial [Chytridium lagenaria]
IELARCPVCPRRRHKFIGPDLGNLGIFNKNNCYLYTHRMMDKMTELMCSAEFSFSSFIEERRWDYAEKFENNRLKKPPSVRVFTAAWFAYRVLQDLTWDNRVQCPFCNVDRCDLVACDGIAIGYRRDKQTLNLRSPTYVNNNS